MLFLICETVAPAPQDTYLVSHLGEVPLHRVRIFPICVVFGFHFADPGGRRWRKERPKSGDKFSSFQHHMLVGQGICFPPKGPFGDSKLRFQHGRPFAPSSSKRQAASSAFTPLGPAPVLCPSSGYQGSVSVLSCELKPWIQPSPPPQARFRVTY